MSHFRTFDPLAPQERAGDISLFELVTPLVRRWKVIAATSLLFAVVAAILLLVQRPVFTAETTFTPEASGSTSLGNLGGLAGLAGQLGALAGSSSSISPDFFAEVVRSREILRAALASEFPDPNSEEGVRRPLLDLLEVEGAPRRRVQLGVTELGKRIDTRIDRRTGILTLAVRMQSAELASGVANRLVELLNVFNLERRQSQSREQRRFSGERLAEAERALRQAEEAHLGFLQRNRMYQESPLLSFEANRLARKVQLNQEIFQTHTRAYEEARVAEIRDTPVLTVIDTAEPPLLRTSPRRTRGTLIAAMLGVLVGMAAVVVLEFRARVRPGVRADYGEFQQAWREARSGVASLLRR